MLGAEARTSDEQKLINWLLFFLLVIFAAFVHATTADENHPSCPSPGPYTEVGTDANCT